MNGMKWDKGKPMMGLVPPMTATRIATVMTSCIQRGENPYAINSWRNVSPATRWMDALERHVEAIKVGQLIDAQSRLPHIDHVLTNAAIMSWVTTNRGESLIYPLHTPDDTPAK